jgi:precorrin-2 dehydrogenase/sirohydrochlorin ferrochelatase
MEMTPGNKAEAPVPTLPVNLLLQGKKVLVVGAGKVATRKVEHLVDAGARVTVVGEKAEEVIRRLHEAGTIHLKERAFAAGDVAGMLLVFAATNDGNANGRVLHACRRRGVMCGCVDQRWKDGDLISPAVARMGDVTVAVSTGGRSCRHSRRVRDLLARDLAGLDSVDLLVMGTGHECLPLTRLEPFHVTGERLESLGRLVARIGGVEEFLLISTCNRVELFAVVPAEAGTWELLRRTLGFGALDSNEFYERRGFDAFSHSALLAAGLLSQTPGETHIVSQIKGALALAVRHGWAGGVMQDWLSKALCLAKDIRPATQPLLRGGDVEDWVIRYLEAERAGFRDRAGLVIGAGAVGSRVVEQVLAHKGKGCVYWGYRNRKPVIRPEWRDRVKPVGVPDLGSVLADVDYVVTVAGGVDPVLHGAHKAALARTSGLLMVDAGMPRNIDPMLALCVRGGRLVNLEDLKCWCGVRAGGVAEALRVGREMVVAGRDRYGKILQSL